MGQGVKSSDAHHAYLQGLTLPSVGFITEQTIAGAISTGTHGSGRHSLSHYVQSVRVACYNTETGHAEVREFSAGDELRAARCSLGLLGVILSVTMQCRSLTMWRNIFASTKKWPMCTSGRRIPITAIYLVPWRWSFFVQHRRKSRNRCR